MRPTFVHIEVESSLKKRAMKSLGLQALVTAAAVDLQSDRRSYIDLKGIASEC